MKKANRELEYYDALREISIYRDAVWLLTHSEKEYGLAYDEALEMAYENVIETAKAAIRRRKRPNAR